jgi:hypothetical protein
MTWGKNAATLNDEEGEIAGAYIGPEKAEQKLNYSQIRKGLKSIQKNPTLDGIARDIAPDEGDIFIRSGGDRAEKESIQEAFDLFAQQYGKKKKILDDILNCPFHVVMIDAMSNIRSIAHSKDAPWNQAEFDLVNDKNNDAVYEMMGNHVIYNCLHFFERDEDGEVIGGPVILGICADILVKNELRESLTTERDEKLAAAAARKEAAAETEEEGRLPAPKRQRRDDYEIAIERADEDILGENRPKRLTFNQAIEDRKLRYGVIIPGIGRNLGKCSLLPKNVLLISRGLVAHRIIEEYEDKNLNQQDILRAHVGENVFPLFEFDNLAAILTPEGEVACVSLGCAISKGNLFKQLLNKYRPDLEVTVEKPNICVCSIDGDIFAVCDTAYSLFPEQDNVYLVHCGLKAKVKMVVKIQQFGKSLVARYGTIENYLAALTIYGGDYVHSVNLVTPKDVAKLVRDSTSFDFINTFSPRLADTVFPADDLIAMGMRWLKLDNLTTVDNSPNPSDLYTIKLNHLHHVLLTLHRRFRASKPVPMKIMCACEDPRKFSVCKGMKVEDINVHNSLTLALTVETYLNYLRQQLSLEVKIQVKVIQLDKMKNITRLRGFYRDEQGAIRCGIPPLYGAGTSKSYEFLLGEWLETKEKEEETPLIPTVEIKTQESSMSADDF